MGRAFRKTDMLCLLIGLIGLAVTTPGQIEEVRLGIFGKRAEGKVVEVEERKSTPENENTFAPAHYYLPTFEFTAADGSSHKVKSNLRYVQEMKVGDAVEIAYIPSAPATRWQSVAMLNDPVSLGLYFFFFFSLLLGVTGIFKHWGER